MTVTAVIGMKSLPVLGFLLGRLIAESLEVCIHEQAHRHSESNRKRLVARMIQFVPHQLHALHLSPTLVRRSAMGQACLQSGHSALRLLFLHGLHHGAELGELCVMCNIIYNYNIDRKVV
jgi:hypothetical protein